jgi:hypothetical protein
MLMALVVHVALAFQNPAPIGATVVRIAVAEAAAIWAPYGLAIDRVAPCDAAHGDTWLLAVDTVRAAAPGRVGVRLGAITFGPAGAPEPRITLFLDEVRRFVAGTRVLGAPKYEWPQMLHEQIIGRVVGRVLAHEIGHYVLRTRQHGDAGLMRSIQRSDELAAPSRAGFRLSTTEAAQLRAR